MSTRLNRLVALSVGAIVLSAGLTSCSGGNDDSEDSGTSGSDEKSKLTVFAASSLTNPFGELEKTFEQEHPDIDVVLSLDSSTALATTITEGAPADVLATADEKSMQIIVDASLNSADPQNFASNKMTIVTPAGNPADVQALADLKGTDFILCDPSAPCGAVSAEILANAGVNAEPVSLEDKVTAVLSKVQLGEADAGLVYVSDALGAQGNIEQIDIPKKVNVSTPYFIAPISNSPSPDAAAQWIELVMSTEGQNVLHNDGFGAPAS